MSALRCLPYVLHQITRHRVRSALTIAGIAIAMFLFTAVQAMNRGVEIATRQNANDTTLVVYRKDRYCPSSSQLPQHYRREIERIDGVASVTPILVAVSNCRASLDVVTFRGVPKEYFLRDLGSTLTLIEGSTADWLARTDAALVGQTLAARRGLRPGMSFDSAGIAATVAGIIASENPQDQNVAYVALEFAQQSGGNRAGVVTQFNVKVADASLLEPVARAIDERFATAQAPTATFSEKAFIGRVAGDVIELVGFARWLGIGCLAAVLALVGNAIALSAHSRIAEHAVLQTLGFSGALVALLIVLEGVALSLIGGLIGAAAALGVARLGSFTLSVEATSIPVVASSGLLLAGVLVCAATGVVAGLVPAWRASRREIAQCFRAA
jgi:putative ABC transport system permease protein